MADTELQVPMPDSDQANTPSPPPSQTTQIDPYRLVARSINGVENATGNTGAKNPLSSATGNGQFIENTWIPMISSERPDLVQGKTRQQILDLRSNPALSEDMSTAYAKQNAAMLANAGIPVTPGNIYVAHALGGQGALNVLRANPNASLASVVGPDVIAANPAWAKLTVGSFQQSLNNKVSGSIQKPSSTNSSTNTSPTANQISDNDAFFKSADTNATLTANQIQNKTDNDNFFNSIASTAPPLQADAQGPTYANDAKNAAAGVIEGTAGLVNTIANPTGSLVGTPLASLAIKAHDALADKFGYKPFDQDTKDYLLGNNTPQPGNQLMTAGANLIGATPPENVKPDGVAASNLRTAGQIAATLPATGIIGGLGRTATTEAAALATSPKVRAIIAGAGSIATNALQGGTAASMTGGDFTSGAKAGAVVGSVGSALGVGNIALQGLSPKAKTLAVNIATGLGGLVGYGKGIDIAQILVGGGIFHEVMRSYGSDVANAVAKLLKGNVGTTTAGVTANNKLQTAPLN